MKMTHIVKDLNHQSTPAHFSRRQDCFHFPNPNPRSHPGFEVLLKDRAENTLRKERSYKRIVNLFCIWHKNLVSLYTASFKVIQIEINMITWLD